MPRKRIWVPLLAVLLMSGMAYLIYQQLPNHSQHAQLFNQPRSGRSHYHAPRYDATRYDWIARHQSNDGRWSARYFQFYCDDASVDDGPVSPFCDAYANDIAYTSLAILAFYSVNYGPQKNSPYTLEVNAGIKWLLAQGSATGWYSADNRAQALACIALAQTDRYDDSVDYMDLAQKAFAELEKRMLTYASVRPIIGWSRREGEMQTIDFSATAWVVIAHAYTKYHSTGRVGLSEALLASYQQSWIDQHSASLIEGATQLAHEQDQHFAQYLDISTGRYAGSTDAAAAMALGYLRVDPEASVFRTLIANLLRRLQGDVSKFNGIELYMASLALFIDNDQAWVAFKPRKWQLQQQRRVVSGCAAGSAPLHNMAAGNPFLDTVSLGLMLDIYERWPRERRSEKKQKHTSK